MNKTNETRAWREAYKEYCQEHIPAESLNLQNVFTPYPLCSDMIHRLQVYMPKFKKKTFCVFNLEFVDILCYDYGVPLEWILFVTDCKEKIKFAQSERYDGLKTKFMGFKEFLKGEWNMKFDCVIMNPPYQAPKTKEHEGRGKCGTSLWESFVEKSFELVGKGGFVCNIHPNRWRKPKSKIGEVIKSKQIHYLEMHGLEDGRKTFSCQTDYDWYIAQNQKSKTNTQVVDYDGESNVISLKNAPFIPNSNVKEVLSLVAKDGKEKVNLLYNCAYHHQQGLKTKTMSRTKSAIYRIPCVYSINKNCEPSLWFANESKQFVGVSKVIWGHGHSGVVLDLNGEYGLTEFVSGIQDKPSNLHNIGKALMSDKFRKTIMGYRDNGGNVYDKNMIATFRKDFWKEFVDEKGNEI